MNPHLPPYIIVHCIGENGNGYSKKHFAEESDASQTEYGSLAGAGSPFSRYKPLSADAAKSSFPSGSPEPD